jgi:hypothetical protein
VKTAINKTPHEGKCNRVPGDTVQFALTVTTRVSIPLPVIVIVPEPGTPAVACGAPVNVKAGTVVGVPSVLTDERIFVREPKPSGKGSTITSTAPEEPVRVTETVGGSFLPGSLIMMA